MSHNPMTLGGVVLLGLLVFTVAALYASVGNGGASGYLAAMALCGVSAAVMKPTALMLNILVATIATAKFARAGCFSLSLFWPFAVASIPFAFLGGFLTIPGWLYRPLLGVLLLYAAFRLVRTAKVPAPDIVTTTPPLPPALASGAGIGLLSGLTGVGGGIFLSPLLLFMGWAETRQSSGVSAAFILVNSIAGLMGHLTHMATLPRAVPFWALAAVLGGLLGAHYGSRRLGSTALKRLLGVVLAVAGAKLLLTV